MAPPILNNDARHQQQRSGKKALQSRRPVHDVRQHSKAGNRNTRRSRLAAAFNGGAESGHCSIETGIFG